MRRKEREREIKIHSYGDRVKSKEGDRKRDKEREWEEEREYLRGERWKDGQADLGRMRREKDDKEGKTRAARGST